ncbi:hypothetical protein I0C86_26175 [Plantactinospora sp. S1510]|uniref:Uncharacterized protein n=1 Tax=Plantactinospora alkalitolerans TaxID=2789879 RepID=A0ABS0H1S4_9ACTN|nr:hypothetical protein [Plantactinospora alkalitolerans]MBF9132410.1 hypothetical protein [Plantactinospora alkalitolerans]
MPARLSWRLLLVPRLVLVVGVIIWALLNVLLTRRRPQPLRLSPTSDDPVADVLADAQPVPRFADEELDVADLRWIVGVEEMELGDEGGCNTVVGLDDTVSSYADVDADGLEDALADQPGIDAVEHADREVLLVRSVLSLPDVHAAAIRALLAINRNPRRMPRLRALQPAVMSALADGMAPILAGHGFVGRLRMSLEHHKSHIDPNALHSPGFYRVLADDRFVQVVELRNGIGYHNDDGTIVNSRVRLTVEVVEITTTDVVESIELQHGCEVIAGERVLSTSYDSTPATVNDIEHVLVSRALPLCESSTSRAAIVDRWVGGLPWSVPDRLPWEAADIAARWGFRKHARDLLKHGGARRLPQSAAVAAKHGL